MRIYYGTRTEGRVAVWVWDMLTNTESLLASGVKSTGRIAPCFEWGYEGEFPQLLAMSLAENVLYFDDVPHHVYCRFAVDVVAHLPLEGWALSEFQIRKELSMHKELQISAENYSRITRLRERLGVESDTELVYRALLALEANTAMPGGEELSHVRNDVARGNADLTLEGDLARIGEETRLEVHHGHKTHHSPPATKKSKP